MDQRIYGQPTPRCLLSDTLTLDHLTKEQTVRKRTLGASGLEVSAIGLGYMSMSMNYGPPENKVGARIEVQGARGTGHEMHG